MELQVNLNSVVQPSEDVVAREIEGDLIIVPLVAGMGDADDELYTLNETGQAIWNHLDGEKTLGQVVEALSTRFEGAGQALQTDVLGFSTEMVKRGMLMVRE